MNNNYNNGYNNGYDNNNNQNQNIEQQQNNNGKKKKSSSVIILILAVALAVSVGYILGNNVFSKNESGNKQNDTDNKETTDDNKPVEGNNDNKPVEQPEQPQLSDKEAMEKGNELLKTLVSFEYKTNDMVFDKMATYANDSAVTAKDLDDEIVYQIILNKFYNNNPSEIVLSDFNYNVKKVFEDSYTYTPKDYSKNCSGKLYKYDSTNNKYTKITAEGGCGGIGDDLTPYKIYSAGTENGNIVLKVQVIFGKMNEGSTTYYSDYNKTKELSGANNENYEDYLYQGSLYKFTFKYSDGNYVFVKAEPES
jgi:hypothetical protein